MLRTAGNVREDVLEAVRQFRCDICDALTPPGSHRVSSNHQPQHFNELIRLDLFFVTLTRDGKDPLKVAVLTVLDVAAGFVALHLAGSPSSETVSAALGGGWFRFYGPPTEIYADADGAWTSASFEQFLNRYGVQLRTSAAEAPWQHGKIERLQRNLRRSLKAAYAGADYSVEEALIWVAQARNDLSRVNGAEPAFRVLGRRPRLPPGAEDALDPVNLADITRTTPDAERDLKLRELARVQYLAQEAKEKIQRIQTHRSRPQKSFFQAGGRVLLLRRTNAFMKYRGHGEDQGSSLQ